MSTTERQTRRAIEEARELVDVAAVTDAWEAALHVRRSGIASRSGSTATSPGATCSCADGRIHAVIDFGSIGVGDPACDLVIAWDLFDRATRPAFRAALDVDDATWDRGRGWALCTALWALPYYLHTNPPMVAQARYKLAEVLADTP